MNRNVIGVFRGLAVSLPAGTYSVQIEPGDEVVTRPPTEEECQVMNIVPIVPVLQVMRHRLPYEEVYIAARVRVRTVPGNPGPSAPADRA